MAAIQINPHKGTGYFLVREGNGYISREEAVVASGSGSLIAGTVMAQRSTDAKWVPFAVGGANGAGTAKGILFEECDATSADIKRTMIVRHAEVQRAALTFTGTPTSTDKNTAYASLASAAIVMR
jgi:hypothetical protein